MAEEKLAQNDHILEEMVRRLVATFHPEYIYLYGSRARGEAGPDSDYDLMLVVSDSQVPRYRRNQQAFRALCGLGVPKEVIVFTRAEFEAGRPKRLIRNPFQGIIHLIANNLCYSSSATNSDYA